MRGETAFFWEARISFKISIHSPHARGDPAAKGYERFQMISIHSPHARGDYHDNFLTLADNISIHSPHARGDRFLLGSSYLFQNFNPLPSCEGRPGVSDITEELLNFNPLPSCEGRLGRAAQRFPLSHFNPLPSCEGRQHKPLKILLDSRQSIQQKHHSSFF